jgi:SnoaL-like domain
VIHTGLPPGGRAAKFAYAGSVDAIAEYRAASEANDLDRFMNALAPDAELVSPLLARGVIRGKKDLRLLFAAVYGSLSDLRWSDAIMDGDRGFMIAKARVGPFKIDDAMVVELDPDGRIKRLRPHLRPWLASTWFALAVGAKVARHPGVLWRAVRRP